MNWTHRATENPPEVFGTYTDNWTCEVGTYELHVYRRDHAVQHPGERPWRPYHWRVYIPTELGPCHVDGGLCNSLEEAKANAERAYRLDSVKAAD